MSESDSRVPRLPYSRESITSLVYDVALHAGALGYIGNMVSRDPDYEGLMTIVGAMCGVIVGAGITCLRSALIKREGEYFGRPKRARPFKEDGIDSIVVTSESGASTILSRDGEVYVPEENIHERKVKEISSSLEESRRKLDEERRERITRITGLQLPTPENLSEIFRRRLGK